MFHQTFSEKIKTELCHFQYDKKSAYAILSSFLTNNLTIHLDQSGEQWLLKSQMISIVQLLKELINKSFQSNTTLSYSKINKLNNHRTYLLTIKSDLKKMNKLLQLNETYPVNLLRTVKDQRAYLVGAYLSGGSINPIQKSSYHLEIRSTKIHYLRLIQKILNQFKLSISLLKRKHNYVLYIKKATDISDFLKIIGANESMNQLEDHIIARDYYTNIQRLNNLDIANIHKSSLAGWSQIKMIKMIRNTRDFKEQPDKFKFYCSIRLQHPESSLSDIVKIFQEQYQVQITRTGINHYVMKIKEIYLRYKK